MSHFNIARLYQKFVNINPIGNLEHALEEYKFIKDIVDKRGVRNSFLDETDVVEKMIKLIPAKVRVMKKEMKLAQLK